MTSPPGDDIQQILPIGIYYKTVPALIARREAPRLDFQEAFP